MKRLTKTDGIGMNECIKCFDCNSEIAGEELEHCGYCPHWQRVLDRLADYEDTGMEPEEIMGLCEMDKRAKMADLLRLEEYQALGSVEELADLIKARDEGRLLPCKLGRPVYVYYLNWMERGRWLGNGFEMVNNPKVITEPFEYRHMCT